MTAHARDLLSELASNLRWIWNGEFDSLYREIDADLWVAVNHNPTAFLLEVDGAKVEAATRDSHYRVRLERAVQSLRSYLAGEQHWARRFAPALASRPVAYFSAEFGLHESLPIYSGGLGVLAGDYLKSSSDLGLPVWGVTLLYREGYFLQHIRADGTQEEVYTDLDMRRVPLERVTDAAGKPLVIEIPADGEKLSAHVWRTSVGRAHLLLLDGQSDPAASRHGSLARRLYSGDSHTRLLQEVILGIGGYKALRAIGIRPGVIHLNEGHSAFAVLEATAEAMEEEGLSFEAACEKVRSHTVFTTHTPVPAGHDRFSPELICEHLAPLRNRLKLSKEQFVGLGKVRPEDGGETFCMTVLALKFANRTNGVSTLHGNVTRQMWHPLWKERPVREVPIGHVTNGVHVPSWVAPPMARFFEKVLGPYWLQRLCRLEAWESIHAADPFEIWDTKCGVKKKMLSFVQRRLQARNDRLNLGPVTAQLDPEALTIGFARRFVEYKRPTLLFRDPERLARLLTNPERPVQLIFAGKAHPNDEPGKALMREVYGYTQDPRFGGRIVLLENYDMNMGRHLVQGCDLWLNSPRRPYEACGTSGQKAIFNATLNLMTLDGWWAEAFNGRNGYAFGEGLTHSDPRVQDQRDGTDLLNVLETQVVPDFFTRSPEGVPVGWIERILNAWATLAARYNSDRMAMEYTNRCYLATAGAMTADFPTEG